MFSQASVCPQRGLPLEGGGSAFGDTLRYGQSAVNTHPTGMHSCQYLCLSRSLPRLGRAV